MVRQRKFSWKSCTNEYCRKYRYRNVMRDSNVLDTVIQSIQKYRV